MDEFTKVRLTIMMPSDKPNINGTVFTKEAVEDAIYNLRKNLPIIYSDDGTNNKVIGATTGESHIVAWDSDNQAYKVTVDGVLYHCNPEIIVNKIENDKISDFRIASIELTL